MTKVKLMSYESALAYGYSADKRKRRNQHRQSAKELKQHGGGTCANVAKWHLMQARYLGR